MPVEPLRRDKADECDDVDGATSAAGRLPLHSAQESVYYDQLLDADSAKYNVGGYIRLRGRVDERLFEDALQRFWNCSDAERLELTVEDGKPWQRLRCDVPMPALRAIDLHGDADPRARALEWMHSRMDTPFGLERFPLFEHAMLRIGADERWYFLRHHHLSADAYSFALKLRTILACYRDLVAGASPQQQLGLASYREQILACGGYEGSAEQAEDAAYWRVKYRLPPDPIWLPLFGNEDAGASEQAEIALPDDVRQSLLNLARDAGASPLHVLMTMVAAFVAASAGRNDMVVGVPVHNRVYRRQKATFGMLSAIVPSRVGLDLSATFNDALAAVVTAQANDLRHRRYPWAALLRDLRATRPERALLFDLVVNYEPFPQWPETDGLNVSLHGMTSRTESIPLHVKLCDFGDRQPLLLKLDGVRRFLGECSLAELAEQLFTVMQRLLSAPDRPLADVLDLHESVLVEADLGYWRARLHGAPTTLELPFDRPRPVSARRAPQRLPVHFDQDLCAALRRLAGWHGVDPIAVLHGAWSLLLARLAGQRDLIVGVTAASLDAEATQAKSLDAGDLLPIRVDVPGEQSLRSWLPAVAEALSEARAHARVAYSRLVVALSAELGPGSWICAGLSLRAGGDPVADRACDEAALDATDVSLRLRDDGGAIAGELEYDAELFDRETMERWREHLDVLLRAMAADPDATADAALDALPVLSPPQRRQLLEEFNATAQPYPRDATIHGLIGAQARRTPDATAVVDETQRLSYAELDARAERLAAHLRAHGVGADCTVGVYMERAVELVVALLGILKAGGAYVPLDPQYPPQRLRHMLKDSAPHLLLIQSQLRESALAWAMDADAGAEGYCPPLLAVDGDECDWPAANAPMRERTGSLIDQAARLAYVIYTSGSTGQPKGVMNQHNGAVNRLLWAQQRFALTADDRVLQKTPSSFDVSVWEFFLPLLAGAQLVMARPDGHRDPTYLMEAIERYGITMLHFVPSMLQVFLEQVGPSRLSGLRYVLCSGEALPAALRDRFIERLPQVELHNLYGPTEAAVDVTHWRCDAAGAGTRTVPIGHAIANTSMLVLDRHLQPVPIGVAGELFIGGIQVARGYLNLPALSRERFVELAFDGAPSARYYRTGDLGRIRADGAIEFLGRNDHQVKIRGQRIELDEVRAQLLALPGVADCEVLALDRGPSGLQLFAYVLSTAEGRAACTPESLRDGLARVLPQAMLPTVIQYLERMPLTLNGKLDRAALVAMSANAVPQDDAYLAPCSGAERLLVTVVEELLAAGPVGMHERLVDRGWHSLLATQAAHRLRDVYQQEVPLRSLLKAQTLAQVDEDIAVAVGGRERMEAIADTYWLLESLSGEDVADLLLRGVVDTQQIESRYVDTRAN